MEKFRAVLDLCVAHQKALGYGAVSLLTLGSERILSDVAFKCPCDSWNLPYGAVFLLAPALVLFLLGLLLSSRSWKVLTGCCAPSRPCGCAHGGRLRRHLKVLGLSMAGAAVAPFTWLAVALLGGRFYECAATGTAMLQRHTCGGEEERCAEAVLQAPCQGPASSPQVAGLLPSLRAQSQVMGWILIASVFTLVLLTTCISRCRSPISILQLAFWKIYTEQEQRLFEAKAKEHAAQLAEKNINYFFGCAEWEALPTPSPKAWHNISSLFAFNPEEHYYSMIHKYASYKAKDGSIKSAAGDMFPICLTFVDGATDIHMELPRRWFAWKAANVPQTYNHSRPLSCARVLVCYDICMGQAMLTTVYKSGFRHSFPHTDITVSNNYEYISQEQQEAVSMAGEVPTWKFPAHFQLLYLVCTIGNPISELSQCAWTDLQPYTRHHILLMKQNMLACECLARDSMSRAIGPPKAVFAQVGIWISCAPIH